MNKYTPEQIAFIKSGFKVWRIPVLTLFFNAWFEMDKTPWQIRAVINNRRFTCGRKPGYDKGTYLAYTEEQAEFIIHAYRMINHQELAKAFNDRFGTNKTPCQMKSFTGNHKIKSGRSGRFESGHKPWNNGTKGQGLTGPNKGSFKKGSIPANRKPLGTERICSKDGYVLIKVAERNPYTGGPTWYRAKHVVNWEAVNGKVPAGFILRFKDGNKLNCAPENLELITRAEHARLNQLHYNDTPEDLKPTVRAIVLIQMKAGSLKSRQENGARR